MSVFQCLRARKTLPLLSRKEKKQNKKKTRQHLSRKPEFGLLKNKNYFIYNIFPVYILPRNHSIKNLFKKIYYFGEITYLWELINWSGN